MNDFLAPLLQAASEGERTDVIAFLKAFKNSVLLVPQKEQNPKFGSLPPYPARPLDILAVRDDSHIIVPVFSSPGLIENWLSRPLKVRSIAAVELIRILPEDWHIALNPCDEYRKDFTPWELQKLLGDDQDLEDIATELELPHGVEPLEVKVLATDDFPNLKAALREQVEKQPEIREIYLGQEKGRTFEGTEVETLLIGLKLKDVAPAQAERIRTTIKDLIAPYLIGSIGLKVLIGVGFSDLELGVFADFPAEYSAQS